MIINRPKKKKKISRYVVLNIIMIALFTTFIAKLVYLQIYKHEDYKERADISSTRLISENAPRGKIYDSEGNVLATNIQTYTLTYTKPNDENENFYDTMNKVFDILSENGEKYEDDLMLKIVMVSFILILKQMIKIQRKLLKSDLKEIEVLTKK